MTTRRLFFHILVLGVAVVLATPGYSFQADDETVNLKAGVAREIITPKLGGLFMGYGSDKGSTAVHDDLTVTSLSLEYGKTRVVLMSATVCLIGNDLCEKLRLQCGEAAGVPASQVIIAATHTHSGPITTDQDVFGTDAEYLDEIFIPKCVAAAKASVSEMKSATVGVATTKSLVGINRRQILPDNRVILGQNPWGTYDPEMTVISFRGEDGKPFANIVHCTAHCTAAGNNTEVTRDWAGVMIDRLEKESGAVTMFFNGMQGDVSPRMANGASVGNMDHAMEVGGLAGIDAVRAYKDIRAWRNEELSVAIGEVKLPHAPLIPLDEAREELAKLEAAPQARFKESMMNVFRLNIDLHEKGETGESHFVYNQTLIKIGPIVLIPVPFEASSEISLRMRGYSKFGHTLAMGCTNGSNWYLPSQDQICRGGYEVDRFKWSGARQLTDNADMHLVNENIRLMNNF